MSRELNNKLNIVNAINSNIVKSITDTYIDNVNARTAKVSCSTSDIYTETKNLGYSFGSREGIEAWSKNLKRRVKPSVTTTEILQQIVDEINLQQEKELKNNIKEEIKSLNLSTTANPAFMVNDAGVYYRFDDNRFVPEPSLIDVDENGNYTVKTSMNTGDDKLYATYDINHKPVTFKVINSDNKPYSSARYVAKKLNMKQEFVKQYKLHGYSGNASGLTATIKNLLTDPKPSGYYFDQSYSFFKWNASDEQFEVHTRIGNMPGSPMLSDYEFKEDSVVRTDYDGAGIYL